MTNPTITLNNGVEMPLLGLGVYAPQHNSEVQQAVEVALELGCRLIDTASIYVTVHSSPAVNAGQDVAICRGGTQQLKATGAAFYTCNHAGVARTSVGGTTTPAA